MPDGQTVIELELNLRQYLRNVQSAEKAAQRADSAIEEMKDSAEDAAASMNTLGKGVKINIKVNDSQLRTAAGDIDALDSSDPSITIDVTGATEIAGVKADLDTIDGANPSVLMRVSGTEQITAAEQNLLDIDASAPSVDIGVTGDEQIAAAEQNLSDINSANPSVSIDVDANGKADILEVRDRLNDIQRLAKVEFIIKGLGAARNMLAEVAGLPIVSTVTEMNNAMKVFQSTTGQEPTGLVRDLISGEFSRGIAESPEQVAALAGAIEKAELGGDKLAGSLQSIYDFSFVSKKGIDEITNAAIGMVNAGLADDIPAAIDQMSVGFQTGADRAGDMLDAMTEFGPKFAEAGFTGAQAFEVFNQALDAGAQNAGRVGEVFNEWQNSLGGLFEGAGNAAFDALSKLDPTGELELLDTGELVAQGEGDGAAFADAVMTSIKDQITSGAISPLEGDALISAIFGSPVAELGLEVFKGIDFGEVLAAGFSSDATETAVAPLRNTMVSAAQELGRVLEFEIADKFRIAGQPLQTLLDGAPAKMREIAELIRQGEGIPEALEIVLEAPGLADTIHDLEMGLTNFVIDLLDGLRAVVDIIPGANPVPLENTVRTLATGQLPFDIMNADNEVEMMDSIQRAWERGVTVTAVEDAVLTAVQELKDEGQLIRAEQLVEDAQLAVQTIQGIDTAWATTLGPITLAAGGESIQGFAGADFTAAAEVIEDARLGFDDYATSVRKAGDDAAASSVRATPLATLISKMGDDATITKGPVNTLGDSVKDLGLDVEDTGAEFSIMTEASIEGFTGLVDSIETETPRLLTSMDSWKAMVDDVKQHALDAYLALNPFIEGPVGYTPGNTSPTGPAAPLRGFAEGGRPGSGPGWVGEDGPEILTFAPGATVLNNQTAESIVSGLAALLSGGFGPGGSNVTNANLNVVINTQGDAAAIGAGGRVADRMRGMF